MSRRCLCLCNEQWLTLSVKWAEVDSVSVMSRGWLCPCNKQRLVLNLPLIILFILITCKLCMYMHVWVSVWHHSNLLSLCTDLSLLCLQKAESFQSPPSTPTPGAGSTQGLAASSVPASSSSSSSAAQPGTASATAQAASNLSRANKKKRKRVNLLVTFVCLFLSLLSDIVKY